MALIVCSLAAWLRPDLITLALSAVILLLLFHSVHLSNQSRALFRARQKAEQEKQLLVESIDCAPLAFAVYGPDDRLLAWNKSYEQFYPESFARLREHAQSEAPLYADLIAESVPEDVPPDQVEAYIEQRVRDQRQADGTPVDRRYPVGGWCRVTKYLTAHGAIAGFAVDISALKKKEEELRAEIERRQQVEASLKVLATTDSLTGTLNRRSFMDCISIELKRYKRFGTPMSIVMLDIDWFKSINDRFGHQTGDEVIVAVVDSAKREIRDGIDKIGRVGGEEFGIVLPHTRINDARDCADRIRERISALVFDTAEGTSLSCTVSLGVSSANPDNLRLAAIIGEADRAMYESKASGRNRTTLFSSRYDSTQKLTNDSREEPAKSC